MKQIALRILLLIGWISSVALAAAPPDQLTLADLVNRPDRWPDTVILQNDYNFSSGGSAHKGDKVRVTGFDGSQVMVDTAADIVFGVAPQDCGLLDAANQAWAALTPAQRAIDLPTLVADASLWPNTLKLTAGMTCNWGALPAGTELILRRVSTEGVEFGWPNSPNWVNMDIAGTDVFNRARQLVLVDPDKRPSRIIAALQGHLVDSDGKPYQDPHLFQNTKIFVLYYGGGYCPPCQSFSPDLVKYLNDALPNHPELAAIYMSNDSTPDQMLAYMKQDKMPFPAVPLKDLNQSQVLLTYAAKLIPELVIIDRWGKILASNDDHNGNRGDPENTINDLKKILSPQPAAQ